MCKMSLTRLQGLFAAHKSAGQSCLQLIQTIKTALLQDLNQLQKVQLPKLVDISPSATPEGSKQQLWKVEEKDDLRFHPLIAGPHFNKIHVQVVSGGLDSKASGVLVLSVGKGYQNITAYHKAMLPRHYHVDIKLGIGTDTNDEGGKILVRSTYHHISREKFDRVVAGLTKQSQMYNSHYGGIDLQSQKAYDLALEGKLAIAALHNQPAVMNARCLRFNPPHATLELECLNEDCEFLRDTINSLGIALRSSAIVSRINRIQDGPFTQDHSLLRKQWNFTTISAALQESNTITRTYRKRPNNASTD